jgi:hypothetical protein
MPHGALIRAAPPDPSTVPATPEPARVDTAQKRGGAAEGDNVADCDGDADCDRLTDADAVADGTVTFAGRRGGNGNLVSIRHAHAYDSGYAHLHRFARGIRAGSVVEQGQIIGYVGSTGLSTGPHLHFALKRNRQFVDPLGEHDIRRPPLRGRALRDFQRLRNQLQAELERLPIPDVQQLDPERVQEGSVEAMDFVGGDFATGEF